MKTIQDQLSTYKSVHLNKKNLITHIIGVPFIIWSLWVLMSLVKLPILVPLLELPLSLSLAFYVVVLVYYFVLNITLALVAMILLGPVLYSAILVANSENAVWIALLVFAVAWVVQFLGHYYEKAKPAFIDDFNQLLIGPLFLIAELLFSLGMLTKLEKQITPLAIKKRRIFEQAKSC